MPNEIYCLKRQIQAQTKLAGVFKVVQRCTHRHRKNASNGLLPVCPYHTLRRDLGGKHEGYTLILDDRAHVQNGF